MWQRVFNLIRCRGDSSPVYMQEVADIFYVGAQEDAHEFLQEALDSEGAPIVGGLMRFSYSERLQCASVECPGERTEGAPVIESERRDAMLDGWTLITRQQHHTLGPRCDR